MADQSKNSRAAVVVASLLLVTGSVAAFVTVRGLLRGDQSAPGEFALILCFLPYVAGALILQITRNGRIAIAVTLIPAIADVVFATAFWFGDRPAWDDELEWSAVRSMVTLIAVPVCLGISLWVDRVDSREQ